MISTQYCGITAWWSNGTRGLSWWLALFRAMSVVFRCWAMLVSSDVWTRRVFTSVELRSNAGRYIEAGDGAAARSYRPVHYMKSRGWRLNLDVGDNAISVAGKSSYSTFHFVHKGRFW